MDLLTWIAVPEWKLQTLVVEEKHNDIKNLNDWIIVVFGQEYFNLFKETYNLFCEKIGRKPSFDHEFGTLVLNAYYQRENFKGMTYGALCSTMYINNSSPNLIEFTICLPHYETPIL
jgi:hypothetical protein